MRGSLRRSLTGQTLLQMAMRVSLIILLATVFGYYHLVASLRAETLSHLTKYVVERGHRERAIFSLAQDNQAVLRDALAQSLQSPSEIPRDFSSEFEAVTERREDGCLRSRDPVDKRTGISLYVGRRAQVTDDFRRKMMISRDAVLKYGPGWHNRFINTYVSFPENAIVLYTPDFPNMERGFPADYDIPSLEFHFITDAKHDPSRGPAWTGLYFDEIIREWMVTCATPVYQNGQVVASVATDVLLSELFKRSINERLPGTYNLIFRGDGRLVVHPDKVGEIQAKQGNYIIAESGDEHLKRIFALVMGSAPGTAVADNGKDEEYVFFAKLDEPNWYFVTIFPKSILSKQAFENSRVYLFLGVASLLLEIIVMYFVLRKQVATPLIEMATATSRIAAGDLNIHLDTKREDELGQLSSQFNAMAGAVNTREQSLKTALVELEESRRRLAEKEALERELAIARTIQVSLVPQTLPLKGLDAAAKMLPAEEVGGDYYDVFQAAGVDWLLIGDVSGHGVTAGLIMMMVQTAVRTAVLNASSLPGAEPGAGALSPSRVLNMVNTAIFGNLQRIDKNQYMTLTAFRVEGRTFTYAGRHQDVIIYRAATGTIETIETDGMWLGILDDISKLLEDKTFHIDEGDVVLLYTDGLTEAKKDGRFLGLEGLCAMLDRAVGKEGNGGKEGKRSQAIMESILDEAKGYEFKDDVSLVVVRCSGEASSSSLSTSSSSAPPRLQT
ncbi:SpoIIE family protein phosphatase [Pendulispora albinea]|uniref:SpoIIE family protein phosphatase n=1 Tax=Pendulispora albinea TaxID=2741071 RepID=A0ABZ2M5L2_9BACT